MLRSGLTSWFFAVFILGLAGCGGSQDASFDPVQSDIAIINGTADDEAKREAALRLEGLPSLEDSAIEPLFKIASDKTVDKVVRARTIRALRHVSKAKSHDVAERLSNMHSSETDAAIKGAIAQSVNQLNKE